ncbi:helix-turn-helix domain-containing protein [Paenibacillus sp. HJGM_3]|uniref:helix-turn-helix domain-containing protein n=1 Tax=Paenibacillus sp. HJGM_3 TaxID=3379816 RepID=UPI00385E5579
MSSQTVKRILRMSGVSFKRKLLVYSLVLSIFPVLTVGLLSSYMASRSLQAEVDKNHRYMLNQMQVQLNQFTNSLNMASIYIATNLSVERSVQYGPGIDNLTESLEMNETIRRIRSTSPVKYHVSILYKRFNNYIYSNEYDPNSFSQQKLPNILDKMKPAANQSFFVPANSFDDQPNMLLFRPIPISSNYTEGVLVLQVAPENILKFVGSVERGQGTRILVADQTGRIVISSKLSEMGRPLNSVVPSEMLDDEREDRPQTMDVGGEAFKLYTQVSPDTNWTYVAMTPMSELTEQSERIKLATWIVVGLLALIWTLVAAIGSKRMYFPIQRLSDKVIPLGKGKSKQDGLAVLDAYMVQLADANRKLNDRLTEQFPYLKQGVFQQLLRGELSEPELRQLADRINMRLQGSQVFVCVAEADDIPAFHRTYQENDRALIHYALFKMMEETFNRFPECTGFTSKTGQVVLLIGADDARPELRGELRQCADEMRANVRQYFRFPVSVAISNPQPSYATIGRGYEEAVALLSHRLVLGNEITIAADRADEQLLRSSRQMVERQKQIVFHVVHGNLEQSGAQLAQLVAELPKAQLKPETARGLFSYMLGELDYTLQQAGCEIQQVTGEDVHERLSRMRSLPELEQWLNEELFPAVKAQLHKEAVSKQARTVSQVVQFVQDRMQDDVSLQLVADHFQLSLSYLSRIFKEESGRTFSEFVLELKMTKAKEWLEHTDMPIKEIAEQLGYSSVQNFNRTFKQWHSVPPGEFRKWKRDGA